MRPERSQPRYNGRREDGARGQRAAQGPGERRQRVGGEGGLEVEVEAVDAPLRRAPDHVVDEALAGRGGDGAEPLVVDREQDLRAVGLHGLDPALDLLGREALGEEGEVEGVVLGDGYEGKGNDVDVWGHLVQGRRRGIGLLADPVVDEYLLVHLVSSK